VVQPAVARAGEALVREAAGDGATAEVRAADGAASTARGLGGGPRSSASAGSTAWSSAGRLTSRAPCWTPTRNCPTMHIGGQPARAFFLMQAVVATCLRRGRSTIVKRHFVGRLAAAYLAPYVAAKAGLAGLTRQRRARPPVRPDPEQRARHRLDRDRGRERHARAFHAAEDGWAEAGRGNLRWASLGQVDEIAETSWSSCSRPAAAWSPARSSTGSTCVGGVD